MDTTERILKLVALGWDGKEPELEFLQRVYGINTILSEGGVVITFKNMGKYSDHNIRLAKKNIDFTKNTKWYLPKRNTARVAFA
jgi:hypothetical protein